MFHILIFRIWDVRFWLLLFHRAVKRRWRKWCWRIQFTLLSSTCGVILAIVSNYAACQRVCCLCGFSCLRVCTCNLDRESLAVVEHYFPQYALQEQEILGRKDTTEKVLALTPEDILFTACCIIYLSFFFFFFKECISLIWFCFKNGHKMTWPPLHVRKELHMEFQNEKKPEKRWDLVLGHATKKQVSHSAHVV